MNNIDRLRRLSDVFRCPLTGEKLNVMEHEGSVYLINEDEDLVYETKDGIPVLLAPQILTWPGREPLAG